MNNERKKELIYELINEIQDMDYQKRSSLLSDFLAKGEVVLTTIFGKDSSHVEKFKKAKFNPSITFLGADNTESYMASFKRGKTSIIAVLNGAIKELELKEELFPNFSPIASSATSLEIPKSKKVFIVHGHDDGLKNEVARFVEKLGFEAVILHEQANAGNTIIEKIERHSDVGFAIVLYTPCDEGKSKDSAQLQDRARQNVVFEHGYFIAKLGRSNVVALHKGHDIELPNDISGVVYVKYESGNWKREIADEMDESGYEINYKLVR